METGKRLRVLAAGGCHVVGFPHGVEQSFGYIAAGHLDADYSTLAGLNLRSFEALPDALHENPPDVLILQFGNYECPVQIGKHFRQTFRIKQRPTSSASLSNLSQGWLTKTTTGALPRASSRWRYKMMFKEMYAIAAAGMGKPIYRPDWIEKSLSSLLFSIRPFSIPSVIVLSPLPCADPVSRKFRIKAASQFEMVCKRSDVLFVDSGAALGYSRSSASHSAGLFTDDIHLSPRGHLLLAQAIMQSLSKVLGQRPVSFR